MHSSKLFLRNVSESVRLLDRGLVHHNKLNYKSTDSHWGTVYRNGTMPLQKKQEKLQLVETVGFIESMVREKTLHVI